MENLETLVNQQEKEEIADINSELKIEELLDKFLS